MYTDFRKVKLLDSQKRANTVAKTLKRGLLSAQIQNCNSCVMAEGPVWKTAGRTDLPAEGWWGGVGGKGWHRPVEVGQERGSARKAEVFRG